MTLHDLDLHERRILSAFGSGLENEEAYESAVTVLSALRQALDPASESDVTTQEATRGTTGARERAARVLLGVAEDAKIHVDVRVRAAAAVLGGGR